MSRKPYPARPAKPFRTSSLAWNLDNVARHARAGFEHVRDADVQRHYLFFMQFLAQRGYLLPDAAGNAKHAEEKTELWSNELTSEGYRFVQYAGDRWVGRLLKRDDERKADQFLTKWHRAFKKLPKDTFDWSETA